MSNSYDPVDVRDTTLFISAATGGSTDESTDAIRSAEQRRLTSGHKLPTECFDGAREILEAAGVIFGEVLPRDRFFTEATLPYGWSITPDGSPFWQPHFMHSFLRDGLSRHRAHLVICSDFWDRSATMRALRRYRTFRFHHHKGAIVYKAYDGIRPLFTTEPRPYTPQQEGSSEYFDMDRTARAEAEAYLTEHYPSWEDPAAYWD